MNTPSASHFVSIVTSWIASSMKFVSGCMVRLLLAMCVASALANSASADVISVLREFDYRKLGDNLITLDTVSGRQWLDLTESSGRSYNDMVGPANNCNPRCTKGEFAGWTFAQESDVLDLLSHVGLFYDEFVQDLPNLLKFILTLGPTLDQSGGPGDELVIAAGATRTLTGGVSQDGIPTLKEPTAEYIVCCDSFSVWPFPRQETNEFLAIDDSNSAVPHGIWLFRVPEPSTLSLCVLGLVPLFMKRRSTTQRSRPT